MMATSGWRVKRGREPPSPFARHYPPKATSRWAFLARPTAGWRISVREARNRPFRPNVAKPLPYYVLVEAGNTLKRILSRYPEDVEVISFTRVEDALEKISVVPAQAVIINTPKVLSPVEALQLANPFSNSLTKHR